MWRFLRLKPEVAFLATEPQITIDPHTAYPYSQPFAAFVSDTGGSAGLFLGLNIIGKNNLVYFDLRVFLCFCLLSKF